MCLLLLINKMWNVEKTPDGHEIPSIPDALFGWFIGRKLNIYTDKEGLAAKVVHVLAEHVILNWTISRGRSRCIIRRSFRTTKSIGGKSLTLSSEPLVTDVIVLIEQCTTWSEEAVLGHTYIFISCANMKCLAFSSFSCAKAIVSVYTGGWGNRLF